MIRIWGSHWGHRDQLSVLCPSILMGHVCSDTMTPLRTFDLHPSPKEELPLRSSFPLKVVSILLSTSHNFRSALYLSSDSGRRNINPRSGAWDFPLGTWGAQIGWLLSPCPVPSST